MRKGENYNYLEAISFHHRTNKNCYWLFKCQCGKEYITRSRPVERGEIKSCGCKKSKLLRERPKTWSKPDGIAARNALMNSYRGNAKKRGLKFKLSTEEFIVLTKGNCQYCGIEPQQTVSNLFQQRNGTYTYNGIDRLDNNKGYTQENCVSCCGICNKAKSNLTLDQFQQWIKRIRTCSTT